jgi:hypothetical protein
VSNAGSKVKGVKSNSLFGLMKGQNLTANSISFGKKLLDQESKVEEIYTTSLLTKRELCFFTSRANPVNISKSIR